MNMEIEFKYQKTYRYEIINASPKATKVLYVLHGYGQLVKFFIRKFNGLPENIMIVAPEGMHRFYLKGNNGRVGASWMTKEAREMDIKDNISWLDQLDQQLSREYPIEKRWLLGFSQGGATAARWEILGKTSFDEMILWACVFPPDLQINESSKNIEQPHFVIGDEDEFYNLEQRNELLSYYKGLGYINHTYNGKHDIHLETLSEIIRQMN